MCQEKGLDPWIEVDGGIKAENAWQVIEAGANAIVSGSGVFNQPSYAEAITGVRIELHLDRALEKRQPREEVGAVFLFDGVSGVLGAVVDLTE